MYIPNKLSINRRVNYVSNILESREVTQQLGVFDIVAEDLPSKASIHMVAHIIHNSYFWGSDLLF